MSLSLGTGPLAGSPGGAFNFDLAAAAPPHRLYFADFHPRVRAVVAGHAVIDTRGAKLLYETGIGPRLYAPLEDVDPALLSRTDHSTHCPFKGDASYWTLTVNGATHENAVWGYEAPMPEAAWLEGYACLYPDKVEEWWVEDERVPALRDPFHRIDVAASSRRVRVSAGETVIADSDRAVLLFETGLAPRAYIPRADVLAPIEPADKRSSCPYKGEASYWTIGGIAESAWSYEAPLPESTGIAGHLSFDSEDLEVSFDENRAA